jgi:phosphatidate cytidylyltransferase
MSPTTAIISPIFRFYFSLAVLLLIGGGGLLIALRCVGKNVDHAWRAYCGWLVIVPLLIGAIFLGRAATIVLFTVVAVFGFKEFARATGLYQDWAMTGAVYLGIVAAGVVSLMKDPGNGVPGWYGLYMALPVYVIAAILIIPIVRDLFRGQLQSLALAIVGFIYFGWMFGHLAFLANSRYAYNYVFYLLLTVELNDVAAFTMGKLFGQHPLRPNISPEKTWEGSVGALVVSLALTWALRGTLPHLRAWETLLIGAVVGIGGQLGDLAISVIKRDLGIKNMGAAIPGHGGILDRIDSLIYVSPLFFHIVRYSHDLY